MTEGEQAYHDLVEHLPAMIYRRRHDGRCTILLASDGCRRLTGYLPADLIQSRIVAYGDLIHPEDKAALLEEIEKAGREGRPFECQYRLQLADGGERWVWDTGRVLTGDEKRAWLLEGLVVENSRLRRQAEELLVIQERSRLARELHDSVTQSLYSLTLFAEAGRRAVGAGDAEETIDTFERIAETGRQALKEMRLFVHRLRPSILAREGLVRAVQHRLNAVEGRAGVRHQLLVEGEVRLPPAQEEAVFYVAQEALNNALKHALATEVTVKLRALPDQGIELQVIDNGRGFEPDTAGQSDGLGLIGMQERAAQFGGYVAITSAPGEGTQVEVRLPGAELES